ncbi:unnamed protein product, partial [Ectocarpus sp. 8 AP-2014]
RRDNDGSSPETQPAVVPVLTAVEAVAKTAGGVPPNQSSSLRRALRGHLARYGVSSCRRLALRRRGSRGTESDASSALSQATSSSTIVVVTTTIRMARDTDLPRLSSLGHRPWRSRVPQEALSL